MKQLLAILLLMLPLAAQSQEIKIISFNIRYNSVDDIDGENRWSNRRDAAAKMLIAERPAAIGLQEALLDQLNDLDSRLEGYIRVGVGRDDGVDKGEFMAIYYDTTQLELLSYSTQWLSKTPSKPSMGWDAACMRTVTIACLKVKSTGKTFCYLNTHLDHVGKVARAESTKLLASIAKSFSDKGIPVVIGGDMNSTIDDPIFKELTSSGMKVARKMAKRTSNDITYNAFGLAKGTVIDHFFVRDMKVSSFRTLNGDYGVPYISDHYPIAISIYLLP